MERMLTETDLVNLQCYKAKCNEVRDFTTAVLKGTHTGMMLFGSGGNGKSFSIRETFQQKGIAEIQPEDVIERDKPDDDVEDGEAVLSKKEWGYDSWVNHQGRITPKGLVMQMAKFPQSIHLVEDAETMFDDKNAWGLLRMALHSQDHNLHSRRRVTWKTSVKEGSYDFWFTGSLIVVGNRILNDKLEEVQAVQTRCPCMNFDISNAELIAKMKEMCEKGYKEIKAAPLEKNDCYNVMEFIINEIDNDPSLKKDAKGNDKRLNLRILISGFRFLALSRLEPSINWRNMLLSQMKQLVGAAQRTRKERIHDEKQIAQEINGRRFASQHDKLVEFCKQTGRNMNWVNEPKNSDKYAKGFNAAKQDLKRKTPKKP